MWTQGDVRMYKTVLAFLISFPLLSGVSLAFPTLNETPLLPSGTLSALALPAEPASEPDFSTITLNPRLVVLTSAQSLIEPSLRRSRFADSLFDASLISLVALNIADYVSTRECLKFPHLSEGNPVMKPFVKNDLAFAAVKGGLTIATYFGTKALFKKSKPLGWIASLASNLALSYVVSNNFRLLREARSR